MISSTMHGVYDYRRVEFSSMSLKERREYDRFFEATLSEHHGVISRVVSSYERNSALQEELYQEISVALWKALAKFDHQSSLKTYILSIAHKRAVSHVAKYVKEPRSVEISELELPGRDCPSDEMTQSQRMSQLMAAIYQLALGDRQLVTLALEGLSYKEIAHILGISVSNVGVKLNRAKTKLNQLLEEVKV
ncbi:sigma-70 family RNA polymerase sigma factor [Aliikangiella marina]|uniref:Sigma-70 family RNA polymerase sigma factor n=1 Tax=Aliikangiella marina TaxID=1712262 RepID=A0A545TCY7_9GAMM|nr:sigma-70 family RNA polymerase sigma factor [Aliikangiella marina]TQV75080.1 sigma-70 family RNA polymerase sigma factor [Aliikangiella marina]